MVRDGSRKIGRLETFYSCDVPDGLPYVGFPQLTASRPRLHPEITAVTEGKEHLPRCMALLGRDEAFSSTSAHMP